MSPTWPRMMATSIDVVWPSGTDIAETVWSWRSSRPCGTRAARLRTDWSMAQLTTPKHGACAGRAGLDDRPRRTRSRITSGRLAVPDNCICASSCMTNSSSMAIRCMEALRGNACDHAIKSLWQADGRNDIALRFSRRLPGDKGTPIMLMA